MKAELKVNSVNQIIKGTEIFLAGDEVTEIALVIKGRVRVQATGVNLVVGSGNFLGICDLTQKVHQVTYTAEANSVVYAFPSSSLEGTIRGLMKANKDYAPLMVSTLSKYIRELSKIFDELESQSNAMWQFVKDSYQQYLAIGKKTGARAMEIPAIEQLDMNDREDIVDLDMAEYYRVVAELPAEIQKAYYGVNSVISVHHVVEEIGLVQDLINQCCVDAQYLKYIAQIMILDNTSLYKNVLKQAAFLKKAGEDTTEIMQVFDDINDKVNALENLLEERAGIELGIDHEFMQEAYFELLSGSGTSDSAAALSDGELALVEETYIDVSELDGAFDVILNYAELDAEKQELLAENIKAFMELSDKFSTDDEARMIRRNIMKVYYTLYKKVFLKDFHSAEETPLVIDLFLRYGFLSEKLVNEQIMEELLSLDTGHTGAGACAVYDMKEWLTLILTGKKEPSKSEFDLDYDENLRDMRKTGQITVEQQQALTNDRNAKFEYEVKNMFKTNHRLVFSQVSAFVPFLFTESCTTSISRGYLSKDRVNAAIQRLVQIDFSVFYRETLYKEAKNQAFVKEYIQEEVYPDIIMLPGYGNKGVMWQEISGRRRNSKGRFLMPVFMEGDLEGSLIKLLGRFRWELCRTMQGASWNNIQIKSLTSEYSDFVQFYRKNRELSEDKKEKLKMQIQKCRNNTREVFVVDYENWMKHEAQGGLILTKPVREIMATYCPFAKDIREKVNELPMFKDAMMRFSRERGKKAKEYELKFKVWEKDEIAVPKEVQRTRYFYTEL